MPREARGPTESLSSSKQFKGPTKSPFTRLCVQSRRASIIQSRCFVIWHLNLGLSLCSQGHTPRGSHQLLRLRKPCKTVFARRNVHAKAAHYPFGYQAIQCCSRSNNTSLDFGISLKVRGRDDVVTGYRGTRGWVTPELGWDERPNETFSAICADLWTCGKALKWFLEQWSDNSRSRRKFVELARQLKSHEPALRPSLLLPIDLDAFFGH